MTTNSQNDPIPDNDHGRFVWHDLMTKDADKATGFYSELFGWTVNKIPMGDHTYNMFMVGDTGIGGAVSLPQQEIPPHWISYVSVADVAAATNKASSLGAKVCVPPTAIPNIGEFSVITDPQGAAIATFKHTQPKPPLQYKDLKPGMACWNELWTPDAEAASKFYGELFGWNAKPEDMGPEVGTYHLQRLGNVELGGIMKTMGEGMPPYWCPYFTVTNVDEDLERAGGLGANVIMPCKDIPNVGRFAVISDPQGAVLTLFTGSGEHC